MVNKSEKINFRKAALAAGYSLFLMASPMQGVTPVFAKESSNKVNDVYMGLSESFGKGINDLINDGCNYNDATEKIDWWVNGFIKDNPNWGGLTDDEELDLQRLLGKEGKKLGKKLDKKCPDARKAYEANLPKTHKKAKSSETLEDKTKISKTPEAHEVNSKTAELAKEYSTLETKIAGYETIGSEYIDSNPKRARKFFMKALATIGNDKDNLYETRRNELNDLVDNCDASIAQTETNSIYNKVEKYEKRADKARTSKKAEKNLKRALRELNNINDKNSEKYKQTKVRLDDTLDFFGIENPTGKRDWNPKPTSQVAKTAEEVSKPVEAEESFEEELSSDAKNKWLAVPGAVWAVINGYDGPIEKYSESMNQHGPEGGANRFSLGYQRKNFAGKTLADVSGLTISLHNELDINKLLKRSNNEGLFSTLSLNYKDLGGNLQNINNAELSFKDLMFKVKIGANLGKSNVDVDTPYVKVAAGMFYRSQDLDTVLKSYNINTFRNVKTTGFVGDLSWVGPTYSFGVEGLISTGMSTSDKAVKDGVIIYQNNGRKSQGSSFTLDFKYSPKHKFSFGTHLTLDRTQYALTSQETTEWGFDLGKNFALDKKILGAKPLIIRPNFYFNTIGYGSSDANASKGSSKEYGLKVDFIRGSAK